MFDHLKSMAIFAKVVDAGSFRAAADMLEMSPSVVSRHVSELERRLDCALLYRTTRRMSVTEAGQRVYQASAAMLAVTETGLAELTERSEQIAGRLTVSAPATVFETDVCADGVASFCARYPRIQLEITYSDQKIELLGSKFDLAIRVGMRLDDSRYRARQLCVLERVLVASPSLLANHGTPRTLAELAQLDWVKLAQFSPARQMVSIKGEIPEFEPPVSVSVDSVAALRTFALRGMGVVAIPRVLVESDLGAGALVALDMEWSLMAPGLHAMWPGNATRASLANRFVDHFVEWFRDCGWAAEAG